MKKIDCIICNIFEKILIPCVICGTCDCEDENILKEV